MDKTGSMKLSQKEYLRKYLSEKDDGAAKRKKKKKTKVGPKTVKIIDDDVDIRNMRPLGEGEFSILNNTEDAPQIVGVIDERGPVDFADKRRWRIIADDGEGNVACDSNENYGSMVEASRVNIETLKNSNENGKRSKRKDPSPSRNASSDNDLSPLRENEKRTAGVKHSGKRRGSTKKKQKRESSSDSSTSNSSESSDRKKSKSKKISSRERHHSSPTRKSSESDQSPPRRRENERTVDKKEYSGKEKRRGNFDSDQSPPRKRKYQDRNIETEERRGKGKNRWNSESDQSPPRRRKNHDKEEYRGKEQNRGHSDLDQSPPRRRKNHDKEEHRGKGQNRGNSDSDQSPPRRRKNHDEEQSRKNGQNRGNSDSDQSPPRRRKNHDKEEYRGKGKNGGNSDSDQSPPRRKKNQDRAVDKEEYSRKGKVRRNSDSDLSPPRRSKIEISAKNRSRKSKGSDSDLSPPRALENIRVESRSNRDERTDSRNDAQKRRRDERSPRRSRSRWNDDDSGASRAMETQRKDSGVGGETKMKKTLDGKTAGLQDARALRIETEAHKKREATMFKGMSAEVSGVGQAAVFRDRKTGRRRDFAAEAADTREKEKRQAEIDEKYAKWGRGLKQVDDQAEKRERDMYEMSKPLARYANDADLDKALREVEREGDTMLEEIKKRRIKEGKSEPAPVVYQGSYAPNRFGIRPGHRWDGVDRSNGYEKKWFEARNARTALQEEAYKWSTADM